MASRLWDVAGELSGMLREKPIVKSFLRAFDREEGDLASRVGEVTAAYSWLRISPLLLGVRLNHLPVTAQLLQDPEDEAWLEDAINVGTAFQVVIEFLRSRLPGYPVLRVPHRRRGSAYLIETDENFFHHFPWESELSRLSLQLTGPPDLTQLGSSDDCSDKLHQLVAELALRPPWRRFADARSALSAADDATLTEVGKRFAAAVAQEVVQDQAGDRLMAQFEYRMAVLEEHVSSADGAVLEYLRAFEAVDDLISILAAYMQTLIVHGNVISATPERIDLGSGDEIVAANVVIRPDLSLVNPGEVIAVGGRHVPEGLVYPEEVQHSWKRLDDSANSTVQISGKFVRL